MKNKKLIRFVTVGLSANILLRNQLVYIDQYFDLILATAEDDHLEKMRRETNIHIEPIPFVRDIMIGKDIKALIATYRFIKQQRPDIVHANTPKASLISMISGWAARVPVRIYTVTGVRYQTVLGNKRRLLKFMEYLTCLFATVVNVEGPGVKKFYKSENITSKPLEIIGSGSLCGVPLEKFNPAEVKASDLKTEMNSIDYNPKLRYVLAVGRIVADKGIKELIEAFKLAQIKNTDLRLVLVGPYEKSLDRLPAWVESFIESSPYVYHIAWTNHVERYLYLSNILVQASHREGFPNVPLQAGAMGVPIVCSRISGNIDIVTDRQTGYCFQAGDSSDLLDKLNYVLDNEEEATQYASALQKEVVTRYPQSVIHSNLLKFYQKKLLEAGAND